MATYHQAHLNIGTVEDVDQGQEDKDYVNAVIDEIVS